MAISAAGFIWYLRRLITRFNVACESKPITSTTRFATQISRWGLQLTFLLLRGPDPKGREGECSEFRFRRYPSDELIGAERPHDLLELLFELRVVRFPADKISCEPAGDY